MTLAWPGAFAPGLLHPACMKRRLGAHAIEKGAENLEKREAVFKKINWALMALIALGHLAAGIYYLASGARVYYYALAFCGLLFLPLPYGLYKALRLKTCYSLNSVIYAFFILAYTVGLVFQGYARILYFDKLAHGLSGVLVAFLALFLYYLIKPGREIRREECALAGTFVFMSSVAVAGLWEISEYAISLLFGTDPQNVLHTGVGDTMMDIIVCTAGTLAFVVVLALYYKKGRKGFLMGAFDDFYRQNFLKGSDF